MGRYGRIREIKALAIAAKHLMLQQKNRLKTKNKY
jgi:hypothetical protein